MTELARPTIGADYVIIATTWFQLTSVVHGRITTLAYPKHDTPITIIESKRTLTRVVRFCFRHIV